MDDSNLLCLICPGQPQFSDVSHLLTHAASKAHLANHFKLKLRSEDPHAVELLKQYDDWFDASGLSKQLANRMTNKENRKKRQSGEVSNPHAIHTTKKRASNVGPEGASTPAATLIPDFLDPRLADSYKGKQQGQSATLTPTTPDRLPIVNNNARSRTGPVLRSMRSSNGRSSNLKQPTDVPGLDDKYRQLALPVTPTQPRRIMEPKEATWASGGDTPDPFVDSSIHTQSSGDPDMEKTRAEEIARLKGVLWPGMDLFDSATPKMRRQRNQKKDGTILKQMEATSSCVEPNELVFSPKGTLLKEREITGNVEEYSPLKGETPIPKRRMTRPQSNRLTKADPNVPRAVDRKRQKIAARKGRKNTKEGSVKQESSPPRRTRCTTDRTHSYIGDDEDIGLAINAFGKRPRGEFGVFIDQKDGMQSSYQGQSMEYKGQHDTLTPTRVLLNGKTNASVIIAPRTGHTTVAKENIEPILNSQGRIGPYGWESPFAKRTVFDGLDLDSPYLFDSIGPYDGNDKAGYRSNPLQAPSKHPFYENQYEDEPAATQNGWLSMDQTAPSEETIPEEDNILSSYYLSVDA
ncbi:hypothetical protein N7475_009177 [Penicillium sp. IBT 31633x]|nr:hypothetical protein N7475_009177 [Penicillium sp. IBT 31633x]